MSLVLTFMFGADVDTISTELVESKQYAIYAAVE